MVQQASKRRHGLLSSGLPIPALIGILFSTTIYVVACIVPSHLSLALITRHLNVHSARLQSWGVVFGIYTCMFGFDSSCHLRMAYDIVMKQASTFLFFAVASRLGAFSASVMGG